jgi:hypothetical protein
MHAIVAFLALGLTAPALTSVDPAPSSSALAWIIGLLCGVGLTIALKVDWRTLPERVWFWVRRERNQVRWAALGVTCLGVLVFY